MLRERVQAAITAGSCPVIADILAGVSQDVEVRHSLLYPNSLFNLRSSCLMTRICRSCVRSLTLRLLADRSAWADISCAHRRLQKPRPSGQALQAWWAATKASLAVCSFPLRCQVLIQSIDCLLKLHERDLLKKYLGFAVSAHHEKLTAWKTVRDEFCRVVILTDMQIEGTMIEYMKESKSASPAYKDVCILLFVISFGQESMFCAPCLSLIASQLVLG